MTAPPTNPTPEDLAEQCLACDAPVVLLAGPAGAGKTSAALAVRRRLLGDSFDASVRLLVPNAPAARALSRRLLAENGGALAGAGPMLFADLAENLLASAGNRAGSLPAAHRRLLLRTVVNDLQRNRQLRALGDLAESPGVVAALDRAIAELKRSAIDPANLRSVLQNPSDRQADLLEVYDAYHRHLLEENLYDTEGKLWQARDALAAGRAGPGGLRCLILDGFIDLTPTQLELLGLLAGKLRKLLITLPLGPQADPRERLWQWTGRTRDRLRETFGSDLLELSCSTPSGDAPLARLHKNLFDEARQTAQAPPKALNIIAAAGPDAEVTAVARRVKHLLLDGWGPHRIAVLVRSLETYREPLRRVFSEFGLSAALPGPPLAAVPVVRFCLDLAELPAGNFPHPAVLRILASSYFHPAALGDFSALDAVTARMIIREGNVLGGREACAQAVERFARPRPADSDAEPEETEPLTLGPLRSDPDRIASAGRLLESLFDLAEQAGPQTDLPGIIDALDLRSVVLDTGEPHLAARDLAALEKLADLHARSDRPHSPAEWRDALAAESLPAERSDEAVDLLSALDARALRWDHVFLLGCSEGQFPQPLTESALLSEADRLAWREHRLPLDTRRDLTAREMLLFYLAISRAERSLTLSYLTARADGGASGPGSFLEAGLQPFGGLDALAAAGQVHVAAPGQYAPEPAEVASPAEALRTALARLFGAPDAPPAGPAETEELFPAKLRATLARGLWANHRRWQRGGWTEYDGRLDDPALLDMLARDIPGRTVFSAGQLSTFGLCPWQYFARYVLGLAALAEPQRRLEPVARGLFCHNVLQRTYARLAAESSGPVRLSDLPVGQVDAALDDAVAQESARHERDAAGGTMWTLQRDRLHRQLREYLRSEATNPLRPASLHFELSFGRAVRPGEPADTASTPEPVRLETPAGELRLAGKIDRVDTVTHGGQSGLMVVDYKTGHLPSPAESLDGRNTQMPLYTAALWSLLNGEAWGGVFHGLDGKRNYFASLRESRGSVKPNDAFDEQLGEALGRVGEFLQAMRAGRFDLTPADPKGVCPRCEYRQACQFSPARQQRLAEQEASP